MPFIGIPPFGQTVRTVTTITATANQTTFTPTGGYTVGYCDVYYNGIKLVAGTDFTATDGLAVVLTVGATANAVVEIITYGTVTITDAVRRSGDTFAGAVAINSTLAAGNTTITGNTTTTTLNSGNTAITGTLAAGNTTITGTANVSGAATFSNTTAYTGAATFSNTVTITGTTNTTILNSGNTTVSGTLAVGNTTITGTANVSGATTFSNTVSVANSGIVFGDASTQITAATGFGFKNRIINGSMRINQRTTTSGVTSGYFVDRWALSGCSNSAVLTSSLPTGFSHGISISASSGNPIAFQKIEASNCWDLSGQSVTLSFYAKNISNATTLYASLQYANATDNFGATTTIYERNFGSLTGSWVRYSYTFTNLPSGALNGLSVNILCAGTSTFTMGITGVQLEKGSTATDFDVLDAEAELRRCLRYYYQPGYAISPTITTDSSGRCLFAWPMPVPMRSGPSFSLTRFNTRGADGFIYYPTGNTTQTTSLTCQWASNYFDSNQYFGSTQFYGMPGSVCGFIIFGQDSYLKFNAEL